MMAAHTTMLHVRVDHGLKSRAAEALAGVGLTISDAVRILLTRIAAEGGLPAGPDHGPGRLRHLVPSQGPGSSGRSASPRTRRSSDGSGPGADRREAPCPALNGRQRRECRR